MTSPSWEQRALAAEAEAKRLSDDHGIPVAAGETVASERFAALGAIRDLEAALGMATRNADQFEAESKRLREALRAAEWGGRNGFEGDYSACPACRGVKPDEWEDVSEFARDALEMIEGHAPGCALRAALSDRGSET